MNKSVLFIENSNKRNWIIDHSIKSVKLFRSILWKFSLKKFSGDPEIIASIDVERYTLDEFLEGTGDFTLFSLNRNKRYERWLQCAKNGFALNYENFYKEGKEHIHECDDWYCKWSDDYWDYFKGKSYYTRLSILNEV